MKFTSVRFDLLRIATFCICLTVPTWAQDAGIQQLAAKSSLTPDEQTQIRNWVLTHTEALSSGSDQAAATALGDLKRTLSGSTPAFREAYARAAVESAAPLIARSEAAGSVRLLVAIGMAETADVAAPLIAALTDERPVVRAAAAGGLKRLRPRLAQAGGDFPTRAIRALSNAAKRETVRYVLELQYQAADYSSAGDGAAKREMSSGLLDVLEAHKQAYISNDIGVASADRLAIAAIGTQQAQLDGAAKRKFGTILGHILRYGVQVYTQSLSPGEPPLSDITAKDSAELIQKRNGIEQLILATEAELNKLHGQDAERNVSKFMQDADPTQMKIAMDRWAQLLKNQYDEDFALQQLNDR